MSGNGTVITTHRRRFSPFSKSFHPRPAKLNEGVKITPNFKEAGFDRLNLDN